MFRPFRPLLAALHSLTAELRAVCVELNTLSAAQEAHSPAIERLNLLELSRHQFEAMCEGLLLKAEGKLRAANNAEARERANKKSYEHLLDPLAEVGDEPEAPARDPDSGNNAPPSEEDRLLGLRMALASTPKALALRAKWGVK